jgi:hypothetical protein
VFSCRQEVNFQGVCLNGTHPCLLAVFEPFQIVLVKLAVWIVYGQRYVGTIVSALFPDKEWCSCERYSKAA